MIYTDDFFNFALDHVHRLLPGGCPLCSGAMVADKGRHFSVTNFSGGTSIHVAAAYHLRTYCQDCGYALFFDEEFLKDRFKDHQSVSAEILELPARPRD